ncbi:MAG TPA: MBL fold metallo-hydrolase, partial [Thermomicrobiales bacterium]|nr:MBL fold metallo-hydrolase [Thermomicrobiales bacterium]
MKFNYYGHSTFSIEADGTLVVVDPWFTGNPTNATSASEINPAAILITHAHNDHIGDALEIATRTGATIVSTGEIAGFLGSQGAKAVGGNFGGTVAFP